MALTQRVWFRSSALVILGLAAGIGLASRPPAMAFSPGNDRSGESITATGSVMVQLDNQRNPTPLDAVYHLDYTGARLIAAIPSLRQSGASLTLIEGFAERDLIADFRLSTSDRPHFQMTTGSLGAQAQGMSVLYVFETTTKQVGVYRLTPQASSASTLPRFDLVQLRAYGLSAPKN
ncbi:MAG: hypothetical protein SFX72_00380 [Isosphaeraceae bacterium]|nr:hypothetical protein [Isosphaeraceae bacterium]